MGINFIMNHLYYVEKFIIFGNFLKCSYIMPRYQNIEIINTFLPSFEREKIKIIYVFPSFMLKTGDNMLRELLFKWTVQQ